MSARTKRNVRNACKYERLQDSFIGIIILESYVYMSRFLYNKILINKEQHDNMKLWAVALYNEEKAI